MDPAELGVVDYLFRLLIFGGLVVTLVLALPHHIRGVLTRLPAKLPPFEDDIYRAAYAETAPWRVIAVVAFAVLTTISTNRNWPHAVDVSVMLSVVALTIWTVVRAEKRVLLSRNDR